MARHSDVHLVCAWGNPWLHNMDAMAESSFIEYDYSALDWQDRVAAILAKNGLPVERCEILDLVDNSEMPTVYERCHIAVFPESLRRWHETRCHENDHVWTALDLELQLRV
jgi:hypothetical protein